MRIYLAGGFKSNWQERIMIQCDQHTYLNPRSHHLDDWKEYSAWDLSAIDQCDWVFAYFEKDNPSGYGLVLEIGYARGKQKRVIFVDEISPFSPKHQNHLRIVEFASDVYFNTLEDGMQFLQSLPTHV